MLGCLVANGHRFRAVDGPCRALDEHVLRCPFSLRCGEKDILRGKKVRKQSILFGALVLFCSQDTFATTARFQSLGGLPSDGTPYDVSAAFDVSADGSVVVGFS